MTMRTVIIGTGQAGAQLAVSLREYGYRDEIVLIGDEPDVPYQRPPLSKKYLARTSTLDDLLVRPESYYFSENIRLLTSVRVFSIDRDSKNLALDNGSTLDYDHLVIATGARNRELPMEGKRPGNLKYLRSLRDATELREALPGVRDVAVIGAGFIGLEFASVARSMGANVTVVEAAPRILGRAVSEPMATYLHSSHEKQGTRILTGTGVKEFERDARGDVRAIHTADEEIPVDLVVVGIGVIPNCALADQSGLDVENGIVVDGYLQTPQDPAISGIGDCVSFPHTPHEGAVRLESVQNATAQARYLARRLAGANESDEPYEAVPWFWSHQGPEKLQIAGLATSEDQAVAFGEQDDAGFSVCRFRDGVLTAVESVNRSGDHMAARRALSTAQPLFRESIQHGQSLKESLALTPVAPVH